MYLEYHSINQDYDTDTLGHFTINLAIYKSLYRLLGALLELSVLMHFQIKDIV